MHQPHMEFETVQYDETVRITNEAWQNDARTAAETWLKKQVRDAVGFEVTVPIVWTRALDTMSWIGQARGSVTIPTRTWRSKRPGWTLRPDGGGYMRDVQPEVIVQIGGTVTEIDARAMYHPYRRPSVQHRIGW